MCTSFTYQTPEGPNMLARTMDFSFELDPDVVLVPRNYSWRAGPDEKMYKTKYAFTGLGRFQEEYIFADGINDRGLCCAVLYFPGYASYHDTISEGMLNLAPHEVVFWLLSSFASVDEMCIRDRLRIVLKCCIYAYNYIFHIKFLSPFVPYE